VVSRVVEVVEVVDVGRVVEALDEAEVVVSDVDVPPSSVVPQAATSVKKTKSATGRVKHLIPDTANSTMRSSPASERGGSPVYRAR